MRQEGLPADLPVPNILFIFQEEKDEKEIREYKVDQLKFRPKRRKERLNLSPEEFKELAKLEKDHETVF